MKNYDFLLILAGLFVLRIIMFSGSYADSICLVGLLAYGIAKQIVSFKGISNEALVLIKKNEEETNAKLQVLAEEIVKTKNSAEGLKAAINFTKR